MSQSHPPVVKFLLFLKQFCQHGALKSCIEPQDYSCSQTDLKEKIVQKETRLQKPIHQPDVSGADLHITWLFFCWVFLFSFSKTGLSNRFCKLECVVLVILTGSLAHGVRPQQSSRCAAAELMRFDPGGFVSSLLVTCSSRKQTRCCGMYCIPAGSSVSLMPFTVILLGR